MTVVGVQPNTPVNFSAGIPYGPVSNGTIIGTARGLVETTGDKMATWTLRSALGNGWDKFFGDPKNLTKHTYTNLFNLGEGGTVRENFKGTSLGSGSIANRAKQFGNVLWKGNTEDIKNLMTAESGQKNWGAALGKIGGLGLLGFDVLRTTKKSFDYHSEQDDTNTGLETAKTFFKKAAKNLAAWEVAGVAFALGKAAMPYGGPVTKAATGILAGAVAGAATITALDVAVDDINRKPEATTPEKTTPVSSSSTPQPASLVPAFSATV